MNNPRIYFIEGCDCAGKTTYVDYLYSKHKRVQLLCDSPRVVQKVHFDKPPADSTPNDEFERYRHCLCSSVFTKDGGVCDVFVDRNWWSEEIYARVLGRRVLVTREKALRLDSLFSAYQSVLVFMHPSFATIQERWVSRGDDYIDSLRKLESIYRGYTETIEYCIKKSPLPVAVIEK